MNKHDFSTKVQANLNKLSSFFESLPWEDQVFYNSWLTQTHAYVSYTSTFLQMCNDRIPKDHPLKEHFEHHQSEEVGHEKMSENDIKFMELPGYPVFGVTGVFWKSQFYWIKEHGPTSHLGYSLFLEGLAAVSGPKVLKRIQTAGHKGYTFLKVHAEEDTDHYEQAIKTATSLSDMERTHIYQNMTEGMETYIAILNECRNFAAKTSSKAA